MSSWNEKRKMAINL